MKTIFAIALLVLTVSAIQKSDEGRRRGPRLPEEIKDGLVALHEYLVTYAAGFDSEIEAVRDLVDYYFGMIDTDGSGYLTGQEAYDPLLMALELDPVEDEDVVEKLAEFLGEKLDENWGGKVYPEYVVSFLMRVLYADECPTRIPLLD